jgi:hypothetical protein
MADVLLRADSRAALLCPARALAGSVSGLVLAPDDKQRSGLLQVRLSRGTITQAVIAGSEVVQEKRKGPPRGRAFLVA